MNNMKMIQETLDIVRDRCYSVDGYRCCLKLRPEELSKAIYLSAEQVAEIKSAIPGKIAYFTGQQGTYSAANEDSFCAARRMVTLERYRYELNRSLEQPKAHPNKVLVLNFANPVRPGGGVRHGAKAQEEDLCRKSTLLASLESPEAAPFYATHRASGSPLASDAIILSPDVEIIRDENGTLLNDSLVVSVLTCAAPMANTKERPAPNTLEKILYDRIMGILHVAAAYQYHYLVLGAWGCGAFGNDAKQVSRLFFQALKNFRRGTNTHIGYFRAVVFAVLDHSRSQYNFKCFEEQFRSFYADEIARQKEADRLAFQRQRKERERYLDKIRGSLLGGAVGDALGYPVEFLHWRSIQARYGPKGIQSLDSDMETGFALISDDTQMTLFTANGILFWQTRGKLRGIAASPSCYIYNAYQDWLLTQTGQPRGEDSYSWLLDIPELYSSRAPGGTCLSALSSKMCGSIENPINNSKGCGGIMRVAPVGLFYGAHTYMGREEIDQIGAEIAAITHGHSLGYIPAAVLTHIVNVAVYGGCSRGETLLDAIEDAMDTAAGLFGRDRHWAELRALVDRAEELAGNDAADADNIHILGGGWVAEETLAISIYCALRYSHDFSKGIIAAVNHSGDSDSTGAVTGNILGAWLGSSAIEEKWTRTLELQSVILEMADDLCYGCPVDEYHYDRDPRWTRKYVEGKYSERSGHQLLED